MTKRANLLKHVKGGSGWRYYPGVWLRNGSVRPNHVPVNGKAEHHPEGFYSIEWYENGRRRRQAVGKEASGAPPVLKRASPSPPRSRVGPRGPSKKPKSPKDAWVMPVVNSSTFTAPQPARSRKRIERIGWLWNSFKSLAPIAISSKSTALTCSV
jgi:hypothetical protein